jgi:hypothetical protein
MGVAEASQTRLAYVPEGIIGTTPATPTFQTARYVSEGLKFAKQTVISDEIRGDGNVTDIIDVGRSVAGPVAFELSYGTFDDFLESVFRSTWDTDVLKNGITHKSFTFEKTFEQGATDAYLRFRGCEFNQLDLALESRQIVKGSFGLMGLGSPTPTTTIITGATYGAASTTPVLNAATNVGNLAVTGITAQPKIKTLNLSFKSGLYENDAIGAFDVDSLGMGRFEVTGNMVAYFRDLDTYNAVLNHDDVALSITIGATTGNKYTLLLPKVKLMDGTPMVGGNSQSVMLDVPFQAKFDSGIGATAQITRAVA